MAKTKVDEAEVAACAEAVKRLGPEVMKKVCHMSGVEIDRHVDELLTLITSGTCDGLRLQLLKEEAAICARVLLRRAGRMM